ncbi:hypothetical protein U1Q18_009843 [Sarracenia purpurea var. burkii]
MELARSNSDEDSSLPRDGMTPFEKGFDKIVEDWDADEEDEGEIEEIGGIWHYDKSIVEQRIDRLETVRAQCKEKGSIIPPLSQGLFVAGEEKKRRVVPRFFRIASSHLRMELARSNSDEDSSLPRDGMTPFEKGFDKIVEDWDADEEDEGEIEEIGGIWHVRVDSEPTEIGNEVLNLFFFFLKMKF